MPTPRLDPALAREAYDAYEQCGRNKVAAAKSLGLKPSTFDNRLSKAFADGMHLPSGAQSVMHAVGLDGATIKGGWRHHYDKDGKKLESVRWSTPEGEEGEDLIGRIKDAFEGLSAAPLVSAPSHTEADLLTVYPLADVHLGMMAWGKETGEDYNTKIASDRVKNWVARCVAQSPASETAVVLSVGDFFHANDQTNQTPANKHILDVDTRHFKTLEVGIEALATGIEAAAEKHERVLVYIIPGNHDPVAYLALMFPLFERYRDNPRIDVHKAPGEWFVRQHGKVMLAAHHGDKAKADQMVHAMADNYAPLWGKTRHRFLFTGHKHHHKSADIGGVQWEQLRAVTARDAYAVSRAYAARAQLQAITFHREHGEVSRVKVNAY